MNEYHVSVLLKESIENLNILPGGKYVDLTFGAGGHSRSILHNLSAKGHLYAFDQDADAVVNALVDERFTLIEANFRYLRRFLRLEGMKEVDGILADLGVSSHQLDMPERGFSDRFDAPLDMRMNTQADFTAAVLLQSYSEEKLVDVLSSYGEVRNAKTLAKALVNAGKVAEIRTTFDLNRVLEIGALKDMLTEGYEVLKPGGRFVVITFHSIEDRVVKNFFKTGNFDGEMEKDEFGNISRPFVLINKKVIMAENKEQRENARSRSAKLRIAEKV